MSANQTTIVAPPKVVLVAEDSPTDATLIESAVEKLNCPVDMRIVDDGAEAIAWLAGLGSYANRKLFPMPDVVVTDLKMPKCTGIEVLAWVRAQKKFNDLPVIVHSSSNTPEDIGACIRLGATEFIPKSADSKPLIRVLGSLLHCQTSGNTGSSARLSSLVI